FSRIFDDLERALQSSPANGQRLQQGVQIIHDEALRLLAREGVEKIEAENRPFDPNWHEAVMTVPSDEQGLPPQTVVRVIEPGYRRDGRLIKPAQVVVGV
ncbi:MAG: nucleotide exchange factor GrpE, partial [Anaerolineae bacterium]